MMVARRDHRSSARILCLIAVMAPLSGLHPHMASEQYGPEAHNVLEPPGFLALNYGVPTPLAVILSHAIFGVILGGSASVSVGDGRVAPLTSLTLQWQNGSKENVTSPMTIKDLAVNRGRGNAAAALLILRVFAGLSLFLKHGWEKLTAYSMMVQHFPNPIHIGAHASLAFALLSDGICSLLVVLGLVTRPAAAVILVNLLTVFFLVHHAAFFTNAHVELVWLYIAAFATILFAGPGRFSVDAHLQK